MPLQPRKHIRNLREGVHGGFDYAELEKLGIDPGDILDFSVSTNPAGIPSGILKPVPPKELAKYPDSKSTGLVREISRKTGVPEACIIAGSGSTELIRLAVLAYAGEDDKVLIIGPTYGEYRTAAEIAGAEIVEYSAREQTGFRADIITIVTTVLSEQPKIIFVCSPNNPTGYYFKKNEISALLMTSENSLVVLDEAYAAFMDERWESTDLISKGNLLIIRSMTKDYSLAGLRLGYAIAGKRIIEVLNRISPPWNVNAVAQHAGIAALGQEEYLEKSRESMNRSKEYLFREIEKLGYRCLPSAANFFLVKTGNASGFRSKLLDKRILVRDCTSFGLPEYVRIAPQTMNKNRRLIAALRELVNE